MEAVDVELDRPWWRDRGRIAALVVALVGVALPAARMARTARASGRMQYNDYWPMVDSLLTESGDVRWGGLLEARLGHPVVVPKLAFVANIWATDGSNQGQVVVVFALALTLVALVGVLARSTPGMGRWGRVAVVVAAGAIVFSPLGAWGFVKAMSGTAWLTAQVLALGALAAAVARRRLLAPALAVLATLSYGTGLAVWPALVVTVVVLDRGVRRHQWPTFALGAVTGVVYLRWYVADRPTRGSDAGSPWDVARRTVSLALGPLTSGRDLVFAVALVLLVCAALYACRTRLDALAPWLGVLVFAGGAAVLIARTRLVVDQAGDGEAAFGDGVPSRYWPVIGLVWIGLAGLAVVALHGRRWAPLAVVPVVALCLLPRPEIVDPLHGSTQRHEALAVAMHLGVADGRRVGGGRQPHPEVTEELRAAGHVPFDGSFDLGCGLLGERVDVQPTLPPGTTGEVRTERAVFLREPLQMVGEVRTDRGVDCVVVVRPSGEVVGAGSAHEWSDDTWTLRALAKGELFLEVAVRIDGDLHVVPKAEP